MTYNVAEYSSMIGGGYGGLPPGYVIGPDGQPVQQNQQILPAAPAAPAAQSGMAMDTGVTQPASQPITSTAGLAGAEQALESGAAGAATALVEGYDVASGNLADARYAGLGQIQQGQEAIGRGLQSSANVLAGAGTGANLNLQRGIDAIYGGGSQAAGSVLSGGRKALDLLSGSEGRQVDELQAGEQRGLQTLRTAFDSAVNPLSGFADPGRQAMVLQSALTGALGPEAQRVAMKNFVDDPSLQYQREQAEKALTRNAAAMGGLGGGNVRKALVREAVDRSRMSFNDRIAQLGNIAAQGLQAAGQIGQLRGQEGLAGANLISGMSTRRADVMGNTAMAGADIASNVGANIGNIRMQTGMAGADMRTRMAEVGQRAAENIAQLTQNATFAQADMNTKAAELERVTGVSMAALAKGTGMNVAQVLSDLGSNSAELRSQAGRDLAAAIASTTAQMAGIQQGEGAAISDIVGAQIGNISEILMKEGLLDAQQSQQLATTLANLAVGEGSTAANIAANVGQIEAAGVLGTNKAIQSSISSLMEMIGKNSVDLENTPLEGTEPDGDTMEELQG